MYSIYMSLFEVYIWAFPFKMLTETTYTYFHKNADNTIRDKCITYVDNVSIATEESHIIRRDFESIKLFLETIHKTITLQTLKFALLI